MEPVADTPHRLDAAAGRAELPAQARNLHVDRPIHSGKLPPNRHTGDANA